MIQTDQHPQFFTATILEWKHLLKEDKYKDIILESLRFLVKEQRVIVNSFVIMSNPRLTGRAGYSLNMASDKRLQSTTGAA
ncbi:MAG: hypothetical protein K2Q24_06455 [Chitinophagaceae bacterium]|jgi:hypothetical protein|nr:hypothetical protein [Chitinophagaceae bacterium]